MKKIKLLLSLAILICSTHIAFAQQTKPAERMTKAEWLKKRNSEKASKKDKVNNKPVWVRNKKSRKDAEKQVFKAEKARHKKEKKSTERVSERHAPQSDVQKERTVAKKEKMHQKNKVNKSRKQKSGKDLKSNKKTRKNIATE